jgi:hypothetical protein
MKLLMKKLKFKTITELRTYLKNLIGYNSWCYDRIHDDMIEDAIDYCIIKKVYKSRNDHDFHIVDESGSYWPINFRALQDDEDFIEENDKFIKMYSKDRMIAYVIEHPLNKKRLEKLNAFI